MVEATASDNPILLLILKFDKTIAPHVQEFKFAQEPVHNHTNMKFSGHGSNGTNMRYLSRSEVRYGS